MPTLPRLPEARLSISPAKRRLMRGVRLLAKDDFVAQFTQVMGNLKTAIEGVGGKPNQYAALTIYITNLEAYWNNKKPLGTAYREVFGKYFPAITLVEVKRLYNPDCMIEISGIAVID